MDAMDALLVAKWFIPKRTFEEMFPIPYHSAAAATVVGRLRRRFFYFVHDKPPRKTLAGEHVYLAVSERPLYSRPFALSLSDLCLSLSLLCVCMCVCVFYGAALRKVVEKLNLLESSNGTVLHSEIVGAVKMKVRGMPRSVTCWSRVSLSPLYHASFCYCLVSLRPVLFFLATVLLQADPVWCCGIAEHVVFVEGGV